MRVVKRNTDEPLVEASIVGKTMPKGTSYMGVPSEHSSSNPVLAMWHPG